MKGLKKKVLSALMMAVCTLTACAGLAACEPGTEDVFEGYTINSDDGGYVLYIEKDTYHCYITAKDSEEPLIDGDLSFREENGDMYLYLDDEYLPDETDTFGEITSTNYYLYTASTFTLVCNNEKLGADTVTFTCDKGPMLGAIGGYGSIYFVQGEHAEGMMGFDITPGLIFWNTGKVQFNLIKIQAEFTFTYDQTQGLQFNDYEGLIEFTCDLSADGTEYAFNFTSVAAALPDWCNDYGTIVINVAEFEEALTIGGML